MSMNSLPASLFLAALAVLPAAARAEDPVAIDLTLKDHKFEPEEIKAPPGKAIWITLKNEDDVIEEFDSRALRTEKIVTKRATVTIKLKPLAAGRYPFQGEFHAKTAQGMLVVE